MSVKERQMVTRGHEFEVDGAVDDPGAWGDLVRCYAPYVHAVAIRAYGLGEVEAEEVFQEVFLRIWLKLGRLETADERRACVAAVARRVAAERSRGAQPSDEILRELDGALAVRVAIARLPAAQQEVAVRFFLEGQSEAAIAEGLGMPVATVSVHVRRARVALREELARTRP
jgi:DNA-directed RNA polymerase specialized sigma24 family protein